MNRIQATFNRLSQQNRRALVAYLTAGDPDFDTSLAAFQAAITGGADILEIGVPFSDPTADGPVIQEASTRALRKGMSLPRALELAGRIRKAAPDTPLVLFSYYNPLFHFGLKKLGEAVAAAGVDGLLVVDLPPEEAGELRTALAGKDLPLIRLVAPTTDSARMKTLAQDAGGFLYLITRTGVTGTGGLDRTLVEQHARQLKAITSLPICLGFGISDAKDVHDLAGLADGLVVGSALVKIVAAHAADGRAPTLVAEKIKELRTALDQTPFRANPSH